MLTQWKAQLNRHRAALGGLAVLLVSLFVLAWVGVQTAREAQNISSYRILNDVYDTPLPLTEQPVRQEFTLTEEQTLYGVRLDFATYDRVCRGQVSVRLMQGDAEMAAAAVDAVTLLDNTFADVLLNGGRALQLGAGAYTLEVQFAPETEEDRLGLWYTPETQQDENGHALPLQKTGGTLAMQWIEEYSGHWFIRYYAVVAVLLLLALGLGWLMLFARPQKLWKVFAVQSAVLGLAFSLITPPMVAPDEYAHLAGSYALASSMLGQQPYDEEGQLLMRASDAVYMKAETGDAGVLAYKRMAEHLSDHVGAQQANTPAKARVSSTGVNLLYIPQALGIAAARLLGLGFFAMILLGRLCSLAVYVLLGSFAIAKIPRGKLLLLCTALLPMGLQLAASFSADTLVIGLAFALLAVCLRCVQQPVGKKELAELLVLSALIGPSKAIYVVLVGLVFMIPKESFGGKTRAILAKAGCCLAAACGWLVYNRGYFDYIYRDVDYMGVRRFAWKAALAVAVAPPPQKGAQSFDCGAGHSSSGVFADRVLYAFSYVGRADSGRNCGRDSAERRFHVYLYDRLHLPQSAGNRKNPFEYAGHAAARVDSGHSGVEPGRTNRIHGERKLGIRYWAGAGAAGGGYARRRGPAPGARLAALVACAFGSGRGSTFAVCLPDLDAHQLYRAVWRAGAVLPAGAPAGAAGVGRAARRLQTKQFGSAYGICRHCTVCAGDAAGIEHLCHFVIILDKNTNSI